MQQLMTRHDDNGMLEPYDSIKWIFETHLKEPDDPKIKSAVFYGREDSPKKIELYKEEEPLISSYPVRIWRSDDLILKMQMEDAEESVGFPK